MSPGIHGRGRTSRFRIDVKAGEVRRRYVSGLRPFQRRWRWRNIRPVGPELLHRVDTLRKLPSLPARITLMGDSLRHFRTVFDHASAQLMQLLEFDTGCQEGDGREYARLEREHMDKADRVEIVLIGSDS